MSQSTENRVLVPQGFAVRSQLTTRLSDADGLLLLGAPGRGLGSCAGPRGCSLDAARPTAGRRPALLCSALLWGRWVFVGLPGDALL